jgi:hypothetical protein
MTGPVVHFGNYSIDEQLELLDRDLRAYQRIWLIERSPEGVWGIAIVKDLPQHQWPEPNEYGVVPHSDTYQTIVYRRHECLAKAIWDAREDLLIRNENDDHESHDAEAEEKFAQPINPDPVTGIADLLKK